MGQWTLATSAGSAQAALTIPMVGSPYGIAIYNGGLLISDSALHNLWTLPIFSGMGAPTNVAGTGSAGAVNGLGTTASFNGPRGVYCCDNSGNVYVADTLNNLIRVVSTNFAVSTLAGNISAGWLDATGTTAKFSAPVDVALDPTKSILYVTDQGNYRVRKVVVSSGVVSTLAGSGTRGNHAGVGTALDRLAMALRITG